MAPTAPARVFVSYCFPDEACIRQASDYLQQQPGIHVFFFGNHDYDDGDWEDIVYPALAAADYLLLVTGTIIGDTQRKEAQSFIAR